MKCPECGQETDDVQKTSYKEPFTAQDPREGLMLWGPYSANEGIKVCRWEDNGKWRLHFRDRIVLQV